MTDLSLHLLVHGFVQEAGYRGLVMTEARKRRLRGSVKNLSDGSVEIQVRGEQKIVEEFITTIDVKEGRLQVDEIIRKEIPPVEGDGFRVIHGELAEEMFQGFSTAGHYLRELGSKMDTGFAELGEKVDRVGEKVDRVGEKVDRVGENVDRVGEKVDRVGEKVDRVGEKVDASRTENRDGFAAITSRLDSVKEAILTPKEIEHQLNQILKRMSAVEEEMAELRRAIS